MKTDMTIYLLTGFILVLAGIFFYCLYKREQRKEREQKSRMAARDEAWKIENNVF